MPRRRHALDEPLRTRSTVECLRRTSQALPAALSQSSCPRISSGAGGRPLQQYGSLPYGSSPSASRRYKGRTVSSRLEATSDHRPHDAIPALEIGSRQRGTRSQSVEELDLAVSGNRRDTDSLCAVRVPGCAPLCALAPAGVVTAISDCLLNPTSPVPLPGILLCSASSAVSAASQIG
jgi:hypothetical protein